MKREKMTLDERLEDDANHAIEALSGAAAREDARQLFGIADLAHEFDVSARTIRFYEDKGLLTPERVNGARVYTRRDRARLALALRARAVGFSLEEVRQYLDLYGERGEGRREQLDFVIKNARVALKELRARQMHIAAMISELENVLEGSKLQRQALDDDD